MQIGHVVGLIPDEAYEKLEQKKRTIATEVEHLRTARPQFTDEIYLKANGTYLENASPSLSMALLLRRQEANYQDLLEFFGEDAISDHEIAEEVELQIKYEGYVRRQIQQVEKFKRFEKKLIPHTFNYDTVPGFSREVREKLNRVMPETIGQASRISGVTPAAISLLLVTMEKSNRIFRSNRQVVP
jgi:tRNA uridine 5-carboxymethylaminomethyl modification enzyme